MRYATGEVETGQWSSGALTERESFSTGEGGEAPAPASAELPSEPVDGDDETDG
jgi:hypothetical protein